MKTEVENILKKISNLKQEYENIVITLKKLSSEMSLVRKELEHFKADVVKENNIGGDNSVAPPKIPPSRKTIPCKSCNFV